MEKLDFGAESRLVRHRSYRYIFPPMIGMVFAQIAPVVDGICASGGIGEVALSAIGTTGPFTYIYSFICALCGIGCGVVVSRCSGTGEKAKAGRVFTRAIIVLSIISLVLTALGIIFIDELLWLFCASRENYAYAKEYFRVVLGGTLFLSLNFAGDYILANDNNANLAVAGDIVGAVVNMIVDYVGIFVFHCGIWVLGFGTVFGSVCCVLVYLLHFRKKDRLCCFVKPERKEGDPSLLDIVKPGSAEALMYFFFAVQLLVQNFVLRENGGTSGLANSTIMENLQLVFTIIIAGCTDAVFPMASAFHGEQNKSGMLMVKRSLTRTGFLLLALPVILLLVYPQISIIPYSVDDPFMLRSLPFAIRLVSATQVFIYFATLLIDYLSATGREGKANMGFIVQFMIQIPLTLVLGRIFEMNAPWIASFIAQIGVLVFLCFFCGDLPRGIIGFCRENLLVLKGGNLTPSLVNGFEKEAEQYTDRNQFEVLKKQMIEPLLASLSGNITSHCCFSILKRSDNRLAAILHYESKKDLLEDLPELPESDDDEDDEGDEVPSDTCIRSEFLGMRRMMIILSDQGNEEQHQKIR